MHQARRDFEDYKKKEIERLTVAFEKQKHEITKRCVLEAEYAKELQRADMVANGAEPAYIEQLDEELEAEHDAEMHRQVAAAKEYYDLQVAEVEASEADYIAQLSSFRKELDEQINLQIEDIPSVIGDFDNQNQSGWEQKDVNNNNNTGLEYDVGKSAAI